MINVLVTGVGGFIGGNIANHLYNAGFNVSGVYRNSKPFNNNIHLIQCDLSKDNLLLHDIDIVIHCAGNTNYLNVNSFIDDNISATNNIVNFCEKNNIDQLIHLSSGSVYGVTDSIINENSDIINPDNYGITKLLSERIICESKIKSTLILRLPKIIGSFCNMSHTWIPLLASKLLTNENIPYYNPNREYNNFMHISDLENFITFCINENVKGLFGLASVDSLEIIDVINIMKTALSSSSNLVEKKPRNKLEHPFLINVDKAKDIGFSTISAKDALIKFCMECRSGIVNFKANNVNMTFERYSELWK